MSIARILPAGDLALLVQFRQEISPSINTQVTSLAHRLKEQRIEGILDTIPAFASLLIQYDARIISYTDLFSRIEKLLTLEVKTEQGKRRILEIPVCYGGENGPDLDHIAAHAGMSREEVIAIHSGRDYLIYMLGFLPGFCYLGGLDARIHTPRLLNPRIKIQAGSVGIGGSQTGIYPMDSPGGWQLLGMTPIRPYDPHREIPILYEAGDYIRFVPITQEAFDHISSLVKSGTYACVTHIEEA